MPLPAEAPLTERGFFVLHFYVAWHTLYLSGDLTKAANVWSRT
jgi:hypothetical protein